MPRSQGAVQPVESDAAAPLTPRSAAPLTPRSPVESSSSRRPLAVEGLRRLLVDKSLEASHQAALLSSQSGDNEIGAHEHNSREAPPASQRSANEVAPPTSQSSHNLLASPSSHAEHAHFPSTPPRDGAAAASRSQGPGQGAVQGVEGDGAAGRSASFGRDVPESQPFAAEEVLDDRASASMEGAPRHHPLIPDAYAEPARHEMSHVRQDMSSPLVPRLNVLRGQPSPPPRHEMSLPLVSRDARGQHSPPPRTPRTPRVGGWQLPNSAELQVEPSLDALSLRSDVIPCQSVGGGKFIQKRVRTRCPLLKQLP